MTMARRWAVIACACLAPAAAAAEEGLIERDNVDLAPAPNVTISSVDIDNRLGDVIVEGHDGPGISLSVVKHAPDEDTLERLKINLVPDPSGAVHISAALLVGREARPVAAGRVRIDIHVRAPRAAAVHLRGWDGGLSVSDMRAGAALTAHDGDITVRKVNGLVTTANLRGRQRLSEVQGTVVADGTFGDLDLDTISGDLLAARAFRGTVVAHRVRSSVVRITTTFGDIRFRGELLAGAHVELRSYRGNVTVQATGPFQVDAWSRDGRIEPQVELSQATRPEVGRLVGSYGAGERPAALVLSSTAGRVVIGLMAE